MLTLLIPVILPILFALQADEPSDAPEKSESKWDVSAPQGPSYVAEIDTDEGTWMNLDVSPDGRTIVFDLLGDLYSLPIEGGEARNLGGGIAWDMQPRFSPDGTRIAFTSDAGGGDNLWIMNADGSNRRQVTREDFRLVSSPAWTPDGEYLLGRKHFTSHRSLGAGEIWLYHQSGGEGYQLTTRPTEEKDVGEPACSPDGRYVYYSLDSTPGRTFEYSKDSNQQIYRIDRLDRETGDVIPFVTGPGGAIRPTPSPDGKRLAFVRRVRFQSTLFLLETESGRARALFDGLERDMQETWAIHGVYPTMAWMPDGGAILLWAGGKILRVDAASGAAKEIPFRVKDQRTCQPALRERTEVAPDRFPVRALRWVRVSPAGDQVVYQALGHLYIRPLPDGEPRRLTRQEDHFEFYPSFSRDGQWIVYTTWDDEQLGSIRVAPAAGGEGRVVSDLKGQFIDPVFSPDGRTIVYHKVAGGTITSPLWSYETGLFRIPAEGGVSTLVTRDGSDPQFGASNDRVFLSRRAGDGETDRYALLSIRLDGGEERSHLVSENATAFAVSHDERHVAFTERFNAYVTPLPPTGREQNVSRTSKAIPLERISRDAGENLQWSGDGRTVYWSLGPELFSQSVATVFEHLGREDGKPAEPVQHGTNISFEADQARPEGLVALEGASVITMRGDEVIENGVILVERNRLLAVGRKSEIEVPDSALRVDLTGLTVMPGLIDVHAHGGQASAGITPQDNWWHHANLAFGVTTIHDPSHDTNSIFAVSEMARAGRILSPRTFSTGTILYGAAGTIKAEVDSLDDARSHLRRMQAVGAFSVKSYNQPRRDQRQQIIQAARELGMLVVPEGGSTLQHNLTMIVDGHTGIEHSLPVENIYRDISQLWGKSGVGYTPTLIVGYGGIWGEDYWYDITDVWRNERLKTFVPRFVIDPRSRRRVKSPLEEYNTLRSAGICETVVDAGGKVQLGAHGQLAGLGAHWELWMLHQGGLSAHQALSAATLDGAFYLGLDGDLGSIEPGKLADLIVLEANPLHDLRASEQIRYTMLNGRLFDARTLAPADGREGRAPSYFWREMLDSFPAQPRMGGCLGCTTLGGDTNH
ncbi:MAG: amidohydrolase family protein [Planctomycetota bacterium]